MLNEHQTKVKLLQEALKAGRESGEPRPFNNEAFLSRMHAQHGQTVSAITAGRGRPCGNLALY